MPIKSPYLDIPIPQCNILTYLFGDDGSATSPDPLWFDSKAPSRSLSPAQMLAWARRLGFGLGRLGLGRGDVVMICSPNHVFVPAAYLGVVGAGCVFSGANPAYTVNELAHQLTDTTAKLVLAHPKTLPLILPAAEKAGLPAHRILQFSDEPNPPHHPSGIQDWRSVLGTPAEGSTWRWPLLTDNNEAKKTVATINYSSGTTGLPKGVCVSHANLAANVEQTIFMRYTLRPHPTSRRPPVPEHWIGFLPLYHAYGQLWTILMAAKLGVPVYVVAEFRYEEFLAAVERFRVTSLQVAPPVLVMLAKRPETARYDLSSVRDVLCGAAPLAAELEAECARRFGCRVGQGWGMTEVTCGAIHVPNYLLEGDDTSTGHGGGGGGGGSSRRAGSVGQLDPNCECKLVGDDGAEVRTGEPGELVVRGPNVCMGYWRNEGATREAIDAEGWLRTGDVAVCNEEGFFWIVDRKKELIKVNALQVAPAELEAALLENQHIADAAVVGITLDGQEWPRAYVVLQESSRGKISPRDVRDWLAARVARHKRLAGGVSFVDEVPKLASGKIMRKTMREWARRDAAAVAGDVAAEGRGDGKTRAKL